MERAVKHDIELTARVVVRVEDEGMIGQRFHHRTPRFEGGLNPLLLHPYPRHQHRNPLRHRSVLLPPAPSLKGRGIRGGRYAPLICHSHHAKGHGSASVPLPFREGAGGRQAYSPQSSSSSGASCSSRGWVST